MITRLMLLLMAAVYTVLTGEGRERGDENIKVVLYAATAVTLGALIVGGITAYVNGKLPLIGGGQP